MPTSRRKRNLILSKKAQRDLRNILNYTIQTWGEKQSDIYQGKIEKMLQKLCKTPELGRKTESSLYRIQIEKHYIFYSVDALTLTIIRILHTKMDHHSHL